MAAEVGSRAALRMMGSSRGCSDIHAFIRSNLSDMVILHFLMHLCDESDYGYAVYCLLFTDRGEQIPCIGVF